MFNYIFSVTSPLHSILTIFSKGKKVGEDHLGNKYYVGKARKGYYKERRWVSFKDKKQEASTIPPEWHGWIHHQTNDLPQNNQGESYRKDWQLPHQKNMTGTLNAYRPPGHFLKKGIRDKAAGDYEAWSPEDI